MADLNKFGDLQNVVVTSNKTLTAADQGIVQDVAVDALTITLPSTSAGLTFIIRNRGRVGSGTLPAGAVQSKSVAVSVSPAAADAIAGNGFTAAVNKDAINTKATAQVGDYIKLTGTGTAGVTAWQLEEVSGIWAREA